MFRKSSIQFKLSIGLCCRRTDSLYSRVGDSIRRFRVQNQWRMKIVFFYFYEPSKVQQTFETANDAHITDISAVPVCKDLFGLSWVQWDGSLSVCFFSRVKNVIVWIPSLEFYFWRLLQNELYLRSWMGRQFVNFKNNSVIFFRRFGKT